MGDNPNVRVIVAPYDSGHRGLRMGAGPEHLLEGGLREAIRKAGGSPVVARVLPAGDPPAEVATAFELDRLVSERGREAVAGRSGTRWVGKEGRTRGGPDH